MTGRTAAAGSRPKYLLDASMSGAAARQGTYQTLTQVALTAGVVRPDQSRPKDVDPDSNFLKVANIRVILC